MPDAISGSSALAGGLPAANAATRTGGAAALDGPGLDPSMTAKPDGFDQDMFLQLLVAQLKYQNPLDPMDSSDFMAQTAQFTTVEKLQELTSSLQESLANDRMGTATGMIGRDITFASPDGRDLTETVRSVRFDLTGPVLITDRQNEVGITDVQQVSSRG